MEGVFRGEGERKWIYALFRGERWLYAVYERGEWKEAEAGRTRDMARLFGMSTGDREGARSRSATARLVARLTWDPLLPGPVNFVIIFCPSARRGILRHDPIRKLCTFRPHTFLIGESHNRLIGRGWIARRMCARTLYP